MTSAWPDTSVLSSHPSGVLTRKLLWQGRHNPSHPHFRSALLAESCCLQFALRDDFWLVITLARGSVIWYLTRALKNKTRAKGDWIGKSWRMRSWWHWSVWSALMQQSCPMGKWPLACSHLSPSTQMQHWSVPAGRSGSRFHCQGQWLS